MELIAKADVVLALGTRLNPFSTLPGYGIDYWPKTAKIIQVDINADRIGLTKPVTVGICGDAKLVAQSILAQLAPIGGQCRPRGAQGADPHDQVGLAADAVAAWTTRTTIRARPGTRTRASATPTGCRRARPGARSRPACRRMRSSRSDIGNNCAIGNAYPTFEKGRKYLAPGLFGPCGYGFPVDHRRQDRQPGHARASALPATARSAFP